MAAMRWRVALLSGNETILGSLVANDDVFAAPDALGWAYKYWNADEKDRFFN
jgi:hypothetical protein